MDREDPNANAEGTPPLQRRRWPLGIAVPAAAMVALTAALFAWFAWSSNTASDKAVFDMSEFYLQAAQHADGRPLPDQHQRPGGAAGNHRGHAGRRKHRLRGGPAGGRGRRQGAERFRVPRLSGRGRLLPHRRGDVSRRLEDRLARRDPAGGRTPRGDERDADGWRHGAGGAAHRAPCVWRHRTGGGACGHVLRHGQRAAVAAQGRVADVFQRAVRRRRLHRAYPGERPDPQRHQPVFAVGGICDVRQRLLARAPEAGSAGRAGRPGLVHDGRHAPVHVPPAHPRHGMVHVHRGALRRGERLGQRPQHDSQHQLLSGAGRRGGHDRHDIRLLSGERAPQPSRAGSRLPPLGGGQRVQEQLPQPHVARDQNPHERDHRHDADGAGFGGQPGKGGRLPEQDHAVLAPSHDPAQRRAGHGAHRKRQDRAFHASRSILRT